MGELARHRNCYFRRSSGEFDRLIEKRGYATRREAVRDLVRKELIEIAASPSAEVCRELTLIYDHHARLLLDKAYRSAASVP